jgi:hypothetical protein
MKEFGFTSDAVVRAGEKALAQAKRRAPRKPRPKAMRESEIGRE